MKHIHVVELDLLFTILRRALNFLLFENVVVTSYSIISLLLLVNIGMSFATYLKDFGDHFWV